MVSAYGWSLPHRTNDDHHWERTEEMRLKRHHKTAAATLAETLLALGIAGVAFAAVIAAVVSLNRSFTAVDLYFATQMQQLRIVDYLSRDVKRALSVTTSVDLQSVTVTIPNYIIQAGDLEAQANASLTGTARAPNILASLTGSVVNYGTGTTTVVYSVSGNSILRTENGQVTTIASSTDQLVPTSTDVDLANTEYSNTTVTFMPIFTLDGATASRTGTTLYTTSYLRNKRRG